MKRFHARVEVVSLLNELGLFVEVKHNLMQILICRWVMIFVYGLGMVVDIFLDSKSGDMIEPVLKPHCG